jgi:hypothetical protein
MSTHFHNKMDAREGYAHYIYGICNESDHNRKTCHIRQRMYDKINIY